MIERSTQRPGSMRASPTELLVIAESLRLEGKPAEAAELLLSVLMAARSKTTFAEALRGYLEVAPPVSREEIASSLNEARVHLDAGRDKAAQEILQAALRFAPSEVRLHEGLGQIALAEGRLDAAADAFRRAVFLDERNGSALLGLAQCYLGQERTELAVSCFLAGAATLAECDARLPSIAERLLDLDGADPAGEVLARWLGEAPEQAALEDLVERFAPAAPELLWQLCIALLQRDQAVAARALVVPALTRFQPPPEQIAIAGRLLRKAGDPAAAHDLLVGPHAPDSDRADIQVEIGMACMALGLDEEAIAAFAITLDLGGFEALSLANLGICHRRCGRYSKGAQYSLRAFLRDSSLARTLTNMGVCYDALHESVLALSCYDAALERLADEPEVRFNRSFALLRAHRFEEGWQDYRARWTVEKPNCPVYRFDAPEWDGNACRHLLIWPEQGVGDEVMFASCFADLRSRCQRLIVGGDKRLVPLFERSFGNLVEFPAMDMDEARLRPDAQCALGDAVGHVRPSLESFAPSAGGAYLQPDPIRLKALRAHLRERADGRPIVGISWKSKGVLRARHRNLTAEALVGALPERLFLVNLQYGDVQEEIAAVEAELGREISALPDVDLFSDLDGLAALIAACDFVVSVDNLNVHFAGALGTPCHVLVPFVSDWRWGRHGTAKSYWYAVLRLHWQAALDDWSGCLASLRRTLEDSGKHA